MPSKSLFPQSCVSSGGSVGGLMACAFPRGPDKPDQDTLGNLICPPPEHAGAEKPPRRVEGPPASLPMPASRSRAGAGLTAPAMTDCTEAWPRGATPCPRLGGGQEERPHAQGQGRWQKGATPRPRSVGCVGPAGPRGATPRSRS